MVKRMQSCARFFIEHFHQPIRVFWFCLLLALGGLIFDGTIYRMWSLRRDARLIENKISLAKLKSKQLAYRLRRAQQPEYIEKAATDQFDLVKEGDLIFIFSDEGVE